MASLNGRGGCGIGSATVLARAVVLRRKRLMCRCIVCYGWACSGKFPVWLGAGGVLRRNAQHGPPDASLGAARHAMCRHRYEKNLRTQSSQVSILSNVRAKARLSWRDESLIRGCSSVYAVSSNSFSAQRVTAYRVGGQAVSSRSLNHLRIYRSRVSVSTSLLAVTARSERNSSHSYEHEN